MPSFKHRRTGRVINVSDADAFRFRNARWEEIADPGPVVGFVTRAHLEVPEATVAEVLAWVGDDPLRAHVALESEKAGKKRKGIIDALS